MIVYPTTPFVSPVLLSIGSMINSISGIQCHTCRKLCCRCHVMWCQIILFKHHTHFYCLSCCGQTHDLRTVGNYEDKVWQASFGLAVRERNTKKCSDTSCGLLLLAQFCWGFQWYSLLALPGHVRGEFSVMVTAWQQAELDKLPCFGDRKNSNLLKCHETIFRRELNFKS